MSSLSNWRHLNISNYLVIFCYMHLIPSSRALIAGFCFDLEVSLENKMLLDFRQPFHSADLIMQKCWWFFMIYCTAQISLRYSLHIKWCIESVSNDTIRRDSHQGWSALFSFLLQIKNTNWLPCPVQPFMNWFLMRKQEIIIYFFLIRVVNIKRQKQ